MATCQPGRLVSSAPLDHLAVESVKQPHTSALVSHLAAFGATGAGQMCIMPFIDYGSARVDPCASGQGVIGSFKVYVDHLAWNPEGFVQAICPRQRQWEEMFLDFGTRATARIDLIAASKETSIRRLLLDSNTELESYAVKTRMARILKLAPLSLRLWAEVFHVTHGAITKWRANDPERPELTLVLEMLEQASREHGDLSQWLQQPVASTSVTPLQLLSERRWRAFVGAIKTASAPAPDLARETLERLRRERLPWAAQDAPSLPAEA